MVPPVDHAKHDATARVGEVPIVDAVNLAVLFHQRNDPSTNRLAAVHRPENPLVVHDVFRKEIGPGVPILADHPGLPIVPEGFFHFAELEHSHYSAACCPSG